MIALPISRRVVVESRDETIHLYRFYSPATVFFTACNPSEAPEAYAPSAATITASPNPVSTGEGYGKTTITWDTGDGTEGEVFVSVDGGKERLFHIGAEGSSEISWIQAGKTTEFRLYEGAEHAKMLAKTQVTAHK